MQAEDAIKYLANIFHVIDADGGVDRIEKRVIDKICSEIHAGYFEQMQAKDHAQQHKEQLPTQLDARLSERIRNLEDMMFVAFCDKVLEPTEKVAIRQYVKALAIPKEQLAILKKEAQRRCHDFR